MSTQYFSVHLIISPQSHSFLSAVLLLHSEQYCSGYIEVAILCLSTTCNAQLWCNAHWLCSAHLLAEWLDQVPINARRRGTKWTTLTNQVPLLSRRVELLAQYSAGLLGRKLNAVKSITDHHCCYQNTGYGFVLKY